MSFECQLADDLRTARLQLLADALSGGSFRFYSVPKPAIGVAITSQVHLATVLIPSGLTVVDNLLTLILPSTTMLADGEVAWGRGLSSSGQFVLDGNCGLLSSDALFKFKSLTLTAGNSLTTISASFVEP